MSVFTSLITQELAVPNDPGQTITIRKLAPKHLDAARKAGLEHAREQIKDLDADQDLIDQLRNILTAHASAAAESAATVPPAGAVTVDIVAAATAAAANPMNGLDPLILIQHGVIGWSYEMERVRASYEDLDEETRDWLAEQILRLARPSLFTAATTEDDQKKAHGALPAA